MLASAVQLLDDRGRAVVSLPNVAHAAVRLALLAGDFPYGECGLLDRTHLRFFTYESAVMLLEAAGLVVTDVERVVVPVAEAIVPVRWRALPRNIERWASQQPEALTFQFVFTCALGQPRSGRAPAMHTPGRAPATDTESLLALQARAMAEMDAIIQGLRWELAGDRARRRGLVSRVSSRLRPALSRRLSRSPARHTLHDARRATGAAGGERSEAEQTERDGIGATTAPE